MTDEEIILHYNKRGAAEQVFDRQNNDFGWAHLPKSFMNQNTVFLLITAMAANFYRYIVALPLMAVLFGIKATDRVKSFLFRFIAVPAKWIKTARPRLRMLHLAVLLYAMVSLTSILQAILEMDQILSIAWRKWLVRLRLQSLIITSHLPQTMRI